MWAGAHGRERAPDEWWRCIDKDGNDLREDGYVLTVKNRSMGGVKRIPEALGAGCSAR